MTQTPLRIEADDLLCLLPSACKSCLTNSHCHVSSARSAITWAHAFLADHKERVLSGQGAIQRIKRSRDQGALPAGGAGSQHKCSRGHMPGQGGGRGQRARQGQARYKVAGERQTNRCLGVVHATAHAPAQALQPVTAASEQPALGAWRVGAGQVPLLAAAGGGRRTAAG